MNNLKYFIHRIQDVKLKDLIQIFPLLISLFLIPVFKKKYKNAWLICEEPKEARDNGYWFFKTMVKNHPEQKCIYAIDKTSPDYNKIRDLGEIIQYGSIKHWIVYFCCKHVISSQKGGKPNAVLCAFIELNGLYNSHMIFLQHGVAINDLRWLYADRSRFQLFVTSAVPEYHFIKERFGYQDKVVCLTGLSRFDGLHDFKIKKNRVLVMPTWRSWFNEKSSMNGELNADFKNSKYLRCWREFLECQRLKEMIVQYNLEIIFYLHRNMQSKLQEFINGINTSVTIASWKEYDIQDLMKTSEMMITDYSSVFFDMVYMKKNVIFYQFDIEDFRKAHYQQGYFDYKNNQFGKCCLSVDEVLDELTCIVQDGFTFSASAEEAHKLFFPYYDTNNTERIYKEILKTDGVN